MPPSGTRAGPRHPGTHRLADKRVLVADDDADIAEALRIAIEVEGGSATVVHDGRAALHAVRSEAWDAVVLDMMLPGFSGLALAEELATQGGTPPIVMLTANQGHRHREYALSHGVRLYLQKPVALERVVESLASVTR
ncbi:MAG: response regulator [Planctomycetota bacterium]|nr:response regulator [Planctomycetota bacterium]MDA1105569.1 response regulator [Planctomycetota bacterium]